MSTYPLYRQGNEPDSKQLEKENLTYTFKEVCNLFPELNLEEAKLMQSFVFKEAAYFLMIYKSAAMVALFLMMDSRIITLENGFSLSKEAE